MSQKNFNYRPQQGKLEGEVDAEVVVVGAGISGLVCAKELQKVGVKVIVLEASHHMGGRIRTLRENEFNVDLPKSHTKWLRFHKSTNNNIKRPLGVDNFGFEIGAEFVHGSETILNGIIEQNNFKLIDLFTWAHGDGGPSEHEAPDGGFGMYWIGKDKKLIRFDEQDEELKQMNEALWSLGDRAISITNDDKRTLYEYLKDSGVTDRVIGMAESGYANTVAGTLDKIGFSNMSQCERNWYYDGDGDFRIDGTLEETILRSLADGLNIQFNSPVNQIERSKEGVKVKVLGGEVIKATSVVVTSSISALQRGVIKFLPPLPVEKQEAINSIECEPGLKILVKFQSRFWPEKLHGMVCSDAFAPEIWFDSFSISSNNNNNNNNNNGDEKVYYATAFFTSDQARRVAAMKGDDPFNALLDQFDEMFKVRSRDHYAGGFICDWGAVPYIWGAYATPSKKELPDARKHLATPTDDVLFFAGEATDPANFMTAHAAAITGKRAAGQSLHAVVKYRLNRALSLQSSPISRL